MGEIKVRRYQKGDEYEIFDLIRKDALSENIKDYTEYNIKKMIEDHNVEVIKERAEKYHAYVLTDEDKLVGVGMIAPYWDSLTESIFLTVFIDPDYKGKGLGRKIIETLENDEYFINVNRVEIPASITALEFYRHFGYDFKYMGHIVEDDCYRLEKYPNKNKVLNRNQYNLRPYIDNDYHKYKEFVYQTKKEAYKKYVEEYWGSWIEEDQRNYFEKFINAVSDDAWIIQLNGKDIGFYNGETLDDGSYEIGNICIIPEYQGRGIGTQVLKDIMELHKNQDIHIQFFKSNSVGRLYEKLGFQLCGETDYHYQMVKNKSNNLVK